MWTEVLNATYLDSYRILVQFNNGVRKIVDFTNIVKHYPVFQPLSNLTLFKQFKVTDTLEWDNGKIDIAPRWNGTMEKLTLRPNICTRTAFPPE